MSMNHQNSSSILLKTVQQPNTNRFLGTNLPQLNGNTMFNLANSNPQSRKVTKSLSISAASTSSAALPNSSSSQSSASALNSYPNQLSQYGSSHSSNSINCSNPIQHSTNFPPMLKNSTTSSLLSHRKFAADYQQAVRFDYSDAFSNNTSSEFLTRISQMQRLQIDTVEWEKRKRRKNKSSKANLNNNSNNNMAGNVE